MTDATPPRQEYRQVELDTIVGALLAAAVFFLVMSPYLWPLLWWAYSAVYGPPGEAPLP